VAAVALEAGLPNGVRCGGDRVHRGLHGGRRHLHRGLRGGSDGVPQSMLTVAARASASAEAFLNA
jgi:hypothetical protein